VPLRSDFIIPRRPDMVSHTKQEYKKGASALNDKDENAPVGLHEHQKTIGEDEWRMSSTGIGNASRRENVSGGIHHAKGTRYYPIAGTR